jgi:hypothetical protein
MGGAAGRMRANGSNACERAQRLDARTHAACARSGAARRWALLRNMVTDLIKHERIQTTVAKAKEVSANVCGFPALRAGLVAPPPRTHRSARCPCPCCCSSCDPSARLGRAVQHRD